jgi:hypothetical protein
MGQRLKSNFEFKVEDPPEPVLLLPGIEAEQRS